MNEQYRHFPKTDFLTSVTRCEKVQKFIILAFLKIQNCVNKKLSVPGIHLIFLFEQSFQNGGFPAHFLILYKSVTGTGILCWS